VALTGAMSPFVNIAGNVMISRGQEVLVRQYTMWRMLAILILAFPVVWKFGVEGACGLDIFAEYFVVVPFIIVRSSGAWRLLSEIAVPAIAGSVALLITRGWIMGGHGALERIAEYSVIYLIAILALRGRRLLGDVKVMRVWMNTSS